MANVKLFAEFKSDFNQYYKIEIYDEDYTGSSPDEFKVSSDGFRLTYSGGTDKIYSPVIGSSLAFDMLVKDTATEEFVTNLKAHQQDRYYIKVYKGTESSPEFWWAGYIIQDIVEFEDVSKPFILEVQASDGISEMSDVICTSFGIKNINDMLINAIKGVGFHTIYGADDPILATALNWWSALITYNVNTNPLDECFIDVNAFGTIEDDGTIGGVTFFDVVSQLCQIFGLRFYYSNGQYRAEQLFLRDGAFQEHTYKQSGVKIGNSSVNYVKTIDQTSNKARRSGNMFNFLPAARVVSLEVDKGQKSVIGVEWTNYNDTGDNVGKFSPASLPTIELGNITSANDNQITFRFEFMNSLIVNQPVNTFDVWAKFKLNVKLVDAQNGVTYYLKCTVDSNFVSSTPEWSTTQSGSGYEIYISRHVEFSTVAGFGHISDGQFSIVTPKIPGAGGTVEYDWSHEGFATFGLPRTINSNNDFLFKIRSLRVNTRFGDIANQTSIVSATNSSATIATDLDFRIGTTSIFSGLGERGSITKEIDASGLKYYVPHVGFREGNSGSYIEIQRLLCQEIGKLMTKPIDRYNGRIFSNHDFRQRLTFDSKKFIQTGGTLTANTDTWNGEWFSIDAQDFTPVFDDVIIGSDDSNNITIGGSSEPGGGLDIPGDVNAFSLIATGGLTNNGSSTTRVNAVTGNGDSSAQSVSIIDSMTFVTFGSGTGSYTINLPTAVGNDGLKLSFVSDDSVSASHVVVLDANGSETIDGSATLSINRNFAGVTLMAYNSNWVVIQEKNAT